MLTFRSLLCLLLCAALLCAVFPAGAESTAAPPEEKPWQFGCFSDSRWVRKEPNLKGRVMLQIPAWTVVRCQEAEGGFGFVSANGVTGYVHLGLMIPLSMADPDDASLRTIEGVAEKPVDLHPVPSEQSPTCGEVPAGSRLQVRVVSASFGCLSVHGKTCFIPLEDVTEQAFPRSLIASPTTLYAPASVQLKHTPWYGATATSLPEQTPVEAVGEDGDALVVLWDDQPWFAEQAAFLPIPETEAVPTIAAVLENSAALRQFPLKNSPIRMTLDAGDTFMIDGVCGDYCHGEAKGVQGFVPIHAMQRTGDMALFLARREKEAKDHQFRDIVLSMLEENNPILLKYKATSALLPDDRLTRPQPYPLGIPYLFGGMNIHDVGSIMYGVANSLYYSTNQRYFGGLDCIGFARTVHRQWGMPRIPRISSIPSYADHLLDMTDIPLNQWHERLEVGDCFAMRKSKSYHIALYLGTLRSFGFTAQEVSDDLANLLDNPLVIHVGMNNFATGWYAGYIQRNRIRNVTPPDGGITISILAPNHQAVHSETMWAGTPNEMTFYWTELQGYPLNFMDLMGGGMKWWALYRNDPDNPPPKEVKPATTTNLADAANVP